MGIIKCPKFHECDGNCPPEFSEGIQCYIVKRGPTKGKRYKPKPKSPRIQGERQ